MSEQITPPKQEPVYYADDLVSYRDTSQFTEEDLQKEMDRVYQGTAIEREWCKDLHVYKTDSDILLAGENQMLTKLRPTVGIIPIQRLLEYTPRRAEPDHEFYYSPPYLQPAAVEVVEFVGEAWSLIQREERDEPFVFLPLTSAVRSLQYQENLTTRAERKIAIDVSNDDKSSHQYGWAFDVDAIGLYRYDPVQRHVQSINPRQPHFDQDAELVAQSRADLRGILEFLKEKGAINFVEELPGTKEWVFHICVNPHVPLSDALLADKK
jgi:hypothetical protein